MNGLISSICCFRVGIIMLVMLLLADVKFQALLGYHYVIRQKEVSGARSHG
jgi:hypothetical protein